MADLKGLKITSFTVTRDAGEKDCFKINFDYTYDGGAGTGRNVSCENPDQAMTCVKQMISNEWPQP